MRPVSRNDLIKRMKEFGFTGPLPGGKHQYMKKGKLKVRIPNPHKGDISKGLLIRILQQSGISKKEWERL